VANEIERKELGCPGHFCDVQSCSWRRHTRVGDYRISSVGDYYPASPRSGKREEIGIGRLFETMVFRVTGDREGDEGCGCGEVDFGELDFEGYNTAGEAQTGHERMVEKYLALAQADA